MIAKMWYPFKHKKNIEELKSDVKESFNHVKKDFNKVGEWITHLDDKHALHKNEISIIKNQLLDIQNDLLEIKDLTSFFGPHTSNNSSKQTQTVSNKRSPIGVVQTVVQSDVQTDVLSNLTVMERGIVWALLNSEMRLSYEDLAALLGKNKSTIRGQINIIKQKNGGLIMESREFSGKKRLYIPDEIKNSIIKSVKVKVNQSKKAKK
jgi:predicted transcriptional regulator